MRATDNGKMPRSSDELDDQPTQDVPPEFSGNAAADAWIEKGLNLKAGGQHAEAISCFERAIKIFPQCVRAWVYKGMNLSGLRRWEEAIACFDKGLEFDPQHFSAWVNKGDALENLARFEEALTCYDSAYHIPPDDFSDWRKMGQVFERHGRYEEALSCYDKALESPLNDCKARGRAFLYGLAWDEKAEILRRMGRYQDAIECYDKMIALDSESSSPWCGKGDTFEEVNRFDEATQCYDRAIQLDPEDGGAWTEKGNCLWKMGRPEEAIVCCEKATACNPPYTLGWWTKAIIQEDLGRIEGAIASYEKYLAATPPEFGRVIKDVRKRMENLKSRAGEQPHNEPKKTEPESSWVAYDRKKYQEDEFTWLRERFDSVKALVEWHAKDARAGSKESMQNALESLEKGLVVTHERVVFWIAVIALIALASAELWIGAACIAIGLGLRRWFVQSADKDTYRLDRFRRRFRELLEQADSVYGEMLAEDKEFLRKYEDSILYPLAVAAHKREEVSARELWHVETLYREYLNTGGSHFHLGGYTDAPEDCKLCMAAQRVRKHIEGAISKFESDIESVRQALITKIHSYGFPLGAVLAKDLLEDYRAWFPYWETRKKPETQKRGEEPVSLPMLKTLCNKEWWSFEEADKVRELCRAEKQNNGWKFEWEESYTGRLFRKLTQEMGACATRCGLQELWAWYDKAREARAERSTDWAYKEVRRIIGRGHPEAMFLELHGGLQYWNIWQLETSLHLGEIFDRKLIEQEMQTAKKLIAQKNGKWNKVYEKELQAAMSYARVDELIKAERYKDYGKL